MSDPKIECEIRRKENMKLCKRIDRLNAENEKLSEFAEFVISQECWGHFTVDGGDIQEKAESLGLIYLDSVTPADVESIDYYTKDDIGQAKIYRFTDILKEEKR